MASAMLFFFSKKCTYFNCFINIHKIYLSCFVAYDKVGDTFEIEEEDTLEDDEAMIDSLHYCYCDEKSVKVIKELGELFGLLVPSGPGYWRYDDSGKAECFIDVKEDLEKFEEKWEPFRFHFLMKN